MDKSCQLDDPCLKLQRKIFQIYLKFGVYCLADCKESHARDELEEFIADKRG